MKVHLMSADELRQLAQDITEETARRERATTEADFVADRTRALEQIATEYGVIPYEDMPAGAHLPGQVVIYEGREYRNVSGRMTTLAPGETLTVWEPIETPGEGPPEAPPEDEEPPEEQEVEE